ncbi:MAG: CoA-binding protein [Pseudomonadota bacterium]|nr:CoA-binding protein [Pseudomonadota bacterium]
MLNVAILGATNTPDRTAYQAQRMLADNDHRIFPVSPTQDEVGGLKAYRSLRDIPEPIDVVTVYVGPARLPDAVPDILAVKPARVIFNPGTEAPDIAAQLREAGIATEEACTLVLLRTGQFE